jgi:hypothetical protein
VAEKKTKNADFKELLFGDKKKTLLQGEEGLPTFSPITGKKYSSRFYEILEVRKSLPAW